jgi:hypothetical protein
MCPIKRRRLDVTAKYRPIAGMVVALSPAPEPTAIRTGPHGGLLKTAERTKNKADVFTTVEAETRQRDVRRCTREMTNLARKEQ